MPRVIGALAQNVTQQAQTVARPTGFADIVEKVKPAVISVRVKVDRGPQTSSDDRRIAEFGRALVERFFRRFGGCARCPARARVPSAVRVAQRHDRPGLRLLHLGRRLCGDQQPRGRQGRRGRGHDRRRQDLHRQGDRHRSAHRSRADQGRRPQRLPVRQARRTARRASATGCSRSAIRSASAAP